MGNSTMDLEFITHQRSERSGIYHADNVTNGHGEVGGSMSTIKEGQRRGGIGAADNVWPIGETKRGASVPHSLDALGVWALYWLDCDRVPRIMLSSNLKFGRASGRDRGVQFVKTAVGAGP